MDDLEQDKAMDDTIDFPNWELTPQEVDHLPRILPRHLDKEWFNAPRNARYPD